ncbi:MAG: M56 family metallopeptidase [Actinomycetota bacterium]|jgi:Zn-dependent protease with chaperone function|nr:M56 family metallopeptidase [Actinomycetota bacterium]
MASFEVAVGLVLLLAIGAPHILPLRRVTPALGAAAWMSALALRALVAIGVSVFVFVYLPQTGVYDAIAHWCWHEVLPLMSAHLGLSGHPLVHAAIVLPGLVLAGSLLWMAFGLARAWMAMRSQLRRAVGRGPLGSTVIEDSDIVVGVTGLGRSQIVVSDTALAAMDAEELQASLSHELGHIARRHRPLLLATSMLTALGRSLPGTKAAARELRLCLERDADEYAVARTGDPLALASAICKAATRGTPLGATGLGGSGRVVSRLDYLQGRGLRAGHGLERGTRLLAASSATLVVALALTLPIWAMAVPQTEDLLSATESHCVRG